GDRGVPRERLTDLDRVLGRRSRDHFARDVAGHAALVVEAPFPGVAGVGVEGGAGGERVSQRRAWPRGLVAHTREYLVAGRAPPRQLWIRLVQLDDASHVRVQPTALGGGGEQSPALDARALGERVTEALDPLVTAHEQHVRVEAALAAGRGEGCCDLVLVRAGSDRG